MLTVKHDGSSSREPQENCCVCHRPTRYWYRPNDVALCEFCASTTAKKDVPTKAQWFDLVDKREKLRKAYLPGARQFGCELTHELLEKIVERVKHNNNAEVITDVGVKKLRGVQTMLQRELYELEKLLFSREQV